MNQQNTSTLLQRYRSIRQRSLEILDPLSPEDAMVQAAPFASPTKWHLGHTTWFFDTFVLGHAGAPTAPEGWAYVFNSYYEAAGPRHARAQRGDLSRPLLNAVVAWRRQVDARMDELLQHGLSDELRGRVELGLQHEQQHQELMLMDIKYNLFVQPLLPAYRERPDAGARGDDPSWLSVDAGLTDVGHGDVSFCYDNERPRHRAWLTGARLRTHVVTVSEYQQFIDDGGYATAALWLADGWTWVQQHNVRAPLYWLDEGRIYTLQGVRERRAQEPVCHVSYFEADAFARWASARLPTEFEWEAAASTHEYAPVTGELHPGHGSDGGPMLGGGVWEWTSSAYLPYPGYRPLEGALGEYNGKFMVSQQVLRGAAAITPPGHTRRTYRNFFYPDQRWMMSGIRLASDPM